jgi:hypothetical protein
MTPRDRVLASAFVVLLAAGSALAGEAEPSAAALAAKLRSPDSTYDDWRAVLEAGKPAIPELNKLLDGPNDGVRAAAAVLLYRLGEGSALDKLDGLLESKDEDARREAAAALLGFVGGPAAFDPAAAEEERSKAMAAWRTWWKRNREKALASPPMSALYGKLLTSPTSDNLVALSLSAKQGAARGMRLNVHRGEESVCLLDIVMADASGSVARVVALSARTPPKAGDPFFWKKP